jgi:hypothetical protein
MEQQLYDAFIGLFPLDVANIILSYSDNWLVIQLQNYFFKLLKHITILGEELFEIHENNYKYITKPSSRLA